MLFDTHYESLTGYAFTFLNNSDEAEDVVQQVFIHLWENRMTIEIHTSTRSLLYKAVHNNCLNRIKHFNVRKKHAIETHYAGSNVAHNHNLEHKELVQRLSLALNTLPDQCRKIFEMSRFEQLKYQEIADQLNLSIKTIENQMGKALKILRLQLKDYLTLILMIISKYYNG